jgi:hypothetical protein
VRAFRPRFTIRDSAGVVVATAKVGDPATSLAEGYWDVLLETHPLADLGEFPVKAGSVSRVAIEKEGDSFSAALSAD